MEYKLSPPPAKWSAPVGPVRSLGRQRGVDIFPRTENGSPGKFIPVIVILHIFAWVQSNMFIVVNPCNTIFAKVWTHAGSTPMSLQWCMCRTRVTLHTGWRNSRCGNVTDGLHNDDVRMQKRCPTRDDDNDFSSRQRLRRVVVPSTADTKESPRDRLVPRS